MKGEYLFNRVLGLKFLYDNFYYYFNKDRIRLYFIKDKNELKELEIADENFDTLVLKRSGDISKVDINDLLCKDNRFFNSLSELKKGSEEYEDVFNYCVECHKFAVGENYYSDRLVIIQFGTQNVIDKCDTISFIPSKKPGVSTRDNSAYMTIEYPYDFGSVYKVTFNNTDTKNTFSLVDVSYIAEKLHFMIDEIRNYLQSLNIYKTFQLIVRIDKYLNLLPIDFRTVEAWLK